MSTEKQSFLGEGVKDRIHALPKFNADVSKFVDMPVDEMVAWALTQVEETVVLNISNASPAEREKFVAVNAELERMGAKKIELFDEKQEVGEITKEITTQVIDSAIDAFRKFIAKTLADQPDLLVDEYNKYAAPRGKSYNDVHYWENIGLAPNDSLRVEVTEDLLDVVIDENEAELMEKVGVHLADTAVITETREKIRVLMLGMLSNMVRGLFYKESSPDKVYGPNVYKLRRMAVDAVDEWMEEAA